MEVEQTIKNTPLTSVLILCYFSLPSLSINAFCMSWAIQVVPHCIMTLFILFYMMKNKTKGEKLDGCWVCVDWWDVHISSTHSRGRSAPRWSHTGCRARCPESHAAPCRTHTVLLLNSNHNRMAAISVYWQIQSTAGSSTSSSQSSVTAQWPTLPPRPLNQSLSLFLSVSSLSPEPAEHNKPQIWASFTDFTPETHQRSALQQASGSSTDLFEVGELDELHGHLRVLQLDGFAHSGFGMSRGQTDQSLQCSGCHRRGLRRTRRKEVRVSYHPQHIR